MIWKVSIESYRAPANTASGSIDAFVSEGIFSLFEQELKEMQSKHLADGVETVFEVEKVPEIFFCGRERGSRKELVTTPLNLFQRICFCEDSFFYVRNLVHQAEKVKQVYKFCDLKSIFWFCEDDFARLLSAIDMLSREEQRYQRSFNNFVTNQLYPMTDRALTNNDH